MNIEIFTTIIEIAGALLITFISGKVIVNSNIKKLVPLAVEYANGLVNKTNREKLIKAVAFIEVTLINSVPLPLKAVLDYLINVEDIVRYIERYLVKIKIEK